MPVQWFGDFHRYKHNKIFLSGENVEGKWRESGVVTF